MKKISFPLIALVVTASCAPVSIYYKEGGDVSRMQNTLLSCEVDALAKAPVATQIRQGPPRYIPGSRYCNSNGRCYRNGGFFVSGEVYSVDVNARLRGDLTTQCMGRQGYRPIEVPRCPAGTPNTPDASSVAAMQPLQESSCVVKDTGGKWRVIAP